MMSLKTSSKSRSLNISSLVLKVTTRCHLACKYCYENAGLNGEDMSIDTFKKLIDVWMPNSQKRRAVILFHGGEPTLLPNEWYEEAVTYALTQSKIYNKELDFSIQTNLQSITPSKIDLFLRHNIRVGTSLDGPADLQGSMRGKELKAYQNFKLLQKAGVKVGVLVTISETNYRHFGRICSWLKDEVGVHNFRANVFSPVGRAYNMTPLSPKNIFLAFRDILDFMVTTKASLIEENLALEICRLLADEKTLSQLSSTLCRVRRCGAGEKILGITPHETILPCGSFQWDDRRYLLGELDDLENSGSSLHFKKKVDSFYDSLHHVWADCVGCEAEKICSFGCLAFVLRSKIQTNLDCLPTRMRHKYYVENHDRIFPLYERLVHQENEVHGKIGQVCIRELDGHRRTHSFTPV